jgi:uncharacterized protein YbaP (TraB family)
MKFCLSLFVSVLLVISSYTNAETSLFEITKGDQKLYLGGTIHLLRNSDFPLPDEFEQAYEQAQKLVLETDLQKASAPEYGQKLAQAMMYTGGNNLSKTLSPDVWKELQAFADERQISLGQMIMFKPICVGMILTITEAQKMGIGQGVDDYFDRKARLVNKPFGELESGDELIASMKKIADTDPDLTISATLRDLKKMDVMMSTMVAHWRKGDIKALDKELAGPMRKEAPDVYQALVVERNQLWLPRLTTMLATEEVELVLVGSLHLTGKDGLLAQLKKQGYKVKPYRLKNK